MEQKHKILAVIVVLILLFAGGLYLANASNMLPFNNKQYNTTELTDKLSIDMSKWSYDEENDIYYQIGLVYCTDPETTDYESLAIYVPGSYFDAKENGNGTYTCTINEENKVGNYTAKDAPLVLPINTAGYSSCKAPTAYSANEVSNYTSNGIIYVSAGCRGRENGDTYSGGAPWGVTDLKAAVRYVRFNNESLPGNTENIFTFGHSGGGAQSALMGTTGDSQSYTPYLESIGAAMVDKNGNKISDSVAGSMCWCPITSLDYADEAYEWNMGQYSDSGTRSNNSWTSALSDDLATEYATYINELHLKDANGTELKLEESDNGIYTSGSYYDFMKGVIAESLNNFLNDTTFPYTSSASQMGQGAPSGGMQMDSSNQQGQDMMQEGGPQDNQSSSQGGPDGQMPSGEAPSGDMPSDGGQNSSDMSQQQMPNDQSSQQSGESTTYETAQDYIDSLNNETEWVTYDSQTNTVNVTNIEGFAKTCKNPSKDVGAFDSLDRSEAENNLFGNNESESLHFDKVLADLLKNNNDKYSKYDDYNSSYATEYENDLKQTDSMNKTVQERVDMYNPMYYLCDYYDGHGSSTVAKYWRIHSGIEQGDTASTVEANLALALNQTSGVESVEFETIWDQGHTQAERSGDATTNFINWINECLK